MNGFSKRYKQNYKQKGGRGKWMLALGICLSIYFSYHAIAGKRSVLSYLSLKKENAALEAELAALQKQRRAIEHKVAMLRPGSIDRDYVQELAHVNLGYKQDNYITVISSTENH